MADNIDASNIYEPILKQIGQLAESPILADPVTVEGFRTLVRDGVKNNFFTSDAGADLLRKLQVVDALHELERKGIIVNE